MHTLRPHRPDLVLLAAVFIAGFCIWTGVFTLGPLLSEMQQDIALSDSVIGLLAALPMGMLGLTAIFGGRLADGWGAERTVALGLGLLALGGGMRAVSGSAMPLMVWSLVMGAGTGIVFSAMPSIARQWFPQRLPKFNAVVGFGYDFGIVVVGALSGAVLSPMLGGWRPVVLFWAALTVVALVVWLVVATPWSFGRVPALPHEPSDAAWNPLRVPAIWGLTALLAIQGFIFFFLTIWSPVLYEEAGLGRSAIALRLSLITVASVSGTIVFPWLVSRTPSRRGPMVLAVMLVVIGAIGLVVAPLLPVGEYVWPVLIGIGTQGVFLMVLIRISEVAPLGQTGEASAMVFSIGYLLVALGPGLGGVLRQMTGSLQGAMIAVAVLTLAMLPIALRMPGAPGDAVPDRMP